MIDFIENYYSHTEKTDSGYDEQKITASAIKKVLPLILQNELTERQSLCLRLHYISGKSQIEIAQQLKISQPTVCRHISTAKTIANKCLKYCVVAVAKANAEWQKQDI